MRVLAESEEDSTVVSGPVTVRADTQAGGYVRYSFFCMYIPLSICMCSVHVCVCVHVIRMCVYVCVGVCVWGGFWMFVWM